MKTWVLVLIVAVGIFATGAGAQTAATTNSPFAGAFQNAMGAPSTPATNPIFEGAFQNGIGSQIATTTNFTFALPAQTNLGAASIIATNPFFGRAFHNNIGSQTATTTNFTIAGVPQSVLGAPSMPSAITTNPAFGSSFQSNIGSQIATPTNSLSTNAGQSVIGTETTITNFLFVSSTQSFIGQGQSVFAAPTNGYNVNLTQVTPSIIQFIITATNSNATNWILAFSTTNDIFTVGTDSNAMNTGGSGARLLFGGMGRSDNTSDGMFHVLEATYSGSQIISFAADFIQFDNDDTNSWNEGSIRYNSTIPDTVKIFMAPVAISFSKGNAVLTWSTNLVGFQLEFATNLPVNAWFTNNSAPAIVDGQFTVTVTNADSAGAHVFRLMKPL